MKIWKPMLRIPPVQRYRQTPQESQGLSTSWTRPKKKRKVKKR